MDWLENIVDNCFIRMKETRFLMMTPMSDIHPEMLDHSIESDNDWKGWKPIDSIIDNSNIEKLENDIGFQLPKSYKHFLKYKHFYDFKIPDFAVRFPLHLPNKELPVQYSYFLNSFDPEILINRGYLYFANYQDYGLLCFDTNETRSDNEYPVVYIDHNDLSTVHLYSSNFEELLKGDKDKGNEFAHYLNDFNTQN